MNRLTIPLAFFLFAAAVCHGQRITATLLGDVTDASGATVSGAKVTARNLDTNVERDASTDERGAYRLDFLPAGRYDIVTRNGRVRRLHRSAPLVFRNREYSVSRPGSSKSAPPV